MKKYFYFLCLTLLISCNKRTFPEVKHVKDLPHTVFLPSIDHQIIQDKNIVYAPTLLMAWDEIRKEIGEITTKNEDSSLTIFNQSSGFQGSMLKDEYKTSIEKNGLEILAKAEFNKSLGFEKSFEKFPSKITFKGKQTSGFGISTEHSLKNQLDILYYENNENMIIRLIPKEKDNEIILIRTKEELKTPKNLIELLANNISKGENERKNDSLSWKYSFQSDDFLGIPMISFNYDNDFTEFLNKKIAAKGKEYIVTKAWQRTAFILDEQGAVVESESEMGVKESSASMEKNMPKKMIFDGPFWVILRHTDGFQGKTNNHPYFIAYVHDDSWMKK